MKDLAVLDLSTLGLFLYKVPGEFESEEIEEFINSKGHHLSNCSWGEYDGEIVDLRDEDKEVIIGKSQDEYSDFMELVSDISEKIVHERFGEEGIVVDGDESRYTEDAQDFFNKTCDEIETMLKRNYE